MKKTVIGLGKCVKRICRDYTTEPGEGDNKNVTEIKSTQQFIWALLEPELGITQARSESL